MKTRGPNQAGLDTSSIAPDVWQILFADVQAFLKLMPSCSKKCNTAK